ncbi:hypothetical protein KKE60_08180 [Patescibacteria group bacterium]|uniref:Tail protein n=1 Tax=viral metagenome TaxID=1070528 RepID=A0A6M3MA53_9ZZZZ|nr:hypothetical protein [Patescibacteria group bacterium]
MAYSALPTRTSADTNSSADVNQIQDNLDDVYGSAAVEATLTNSATKIPRSDAVYTAIAAKGFFPQSDSVKGNIHFNIGAGGTIGTLTTDGTWRDADFSSIVPAGATAIQILLYMNDDANSNIQFRKNGNTNIDAQPIMVQNYVNAYQLIISCDTGRVIEYNASNVTWTTLYFTCIGYFV